MKNGEPIKRLACTVLFLFIYLMSAQRLCASDPVNEPLPHALVELQSQGRLTVRALWAWKLVPESTAKMALEFRSLGCDLLSANKEQIMTWLKQAEDGQLQLNTKQKDILTVLVDRMNFGSGAVSPETAKIESVDNSNTEIQVTTLTEPSSASVEHIGVPDDTAVGKRVESMDTTQIVADLGAQAEAGNAKAMLTLALISRTDVAGAPDPYKSIKLLQDASAAGEADAMAALADEYESGLWIKQDLEKANQLRQQAIKAGSQLAQWGVE